MTRTHRTNSIELAATIQAVTGEEPSISFNGSGLATFTFPETSAVVAVVLQFESGLLAPARHLLVTRNILFRRARNVGRAL